MAKAPEQVEFHRDDFPTAGINSHEALDALIAPLNRRLAQDRTALAGGITLANTGFELKTVQVQTPSDDWTAITVSGGGWVNFGDSNYPDLSYRKTAEGRVELRGMVKNPSATPTAFTTFGALSAALLPAKGHIYAASTSNGTSEAFASLEVSAFAGGVRYRGGYSSANAYLAVGTSWTASDRTPVPLSCFPVPFTLSKVKNPEAVFLVGVRDITPAANGGGTEPALALGAAKTRMLDASTVQVQNVPGLLLGRRYELTFLALA